MSKLEMEKSAGQSSLSVQSSELSSSKTDSSNASHRSEGQEKETAEDKGPSPVDMECHIQSERITKSLDKLIYQTKLALSIPYLMRDPVLPDIMSEQHLADIRCIYGQYDNPLFSTSLQNMAAIEEIKAGDMSLKHRVNPELGFMMYTLCSYPELMPRVEMIVGKIKNKFKTMAPPALSYLLTLEEFSKLMVVQMTNTAAEELSLKFRTRKLEECNNNELAKIAAYSKCLKEENENFENDILKKTEIIAELKQELMLFEHKESVRRKKKILDSERQMVLATRAHDVKYQMLTEEEVEVRDHYDTMLGGHMLAEKNLRLRRSKVETQLQGWLQKYDVDMGAKQIDLDELIKKYEDELELKEELEIKLAEQDKEFVPLMEEREKEYDEEMDAKYKQFLMEHAARVIQVAWRDTLRNRAEKRKLKKLQKKLEAERELAERRAEIAAKKAAMEEKKRIAAEKKAAKEAAKQAKIDAAAAKAAEEEAAKSGGKPPKKAA